MIGFVHILSELFLYQIIIVLCSNKNPGIEVCVWCSDKRQSSPNRKRAVQSNSTVPSSFLSEDVNVEVGKSVEEEEELACHVSTIHWELHWWTAQTEQLLQPIRIQQVLNEQNHVMHEVQ